MLRIQRSASEPGVLILSGRIDTDDVEELQRLLDLETADRLLVLDLKDVTLVNQDGVKFLKRCEADSITLDNCPSYIRRWIDREGGRHSRQEQ